jgi:signal transduction histidine kinase
VQRLIDQTRRVGSGDFDALIELGQRDELGKLADELGRMTRQLSAARSQLVTQRRARASLQEQLRHADRLSTVGKVASGIAHELGTPLNVVAGRAAIIGARASDDDVVNNAEIIGQQARRMTEIIRELLDFSRRRGVQRQDVRVADVIHQATTLLEPIAEEKGVDIVVEPMAALRAEIDVNKLLQVLTNLMTNAVQAMPDGGTLTIRAEERDVREPRNDHAEPGAYVAVTVVDQGQGIAEEDLEHIFQPFFTTKRVGRGTGLGLYVCHGIVREQAGWIDVTSKQGEGSSFTVFLPQHGTPRSER